MSITSYHPVLTTDDVRRSTELYIGRPDFEGLFDSNWYVHLRSRHFAELNLAILDGQHEAIPAVARGRAHGVLLNFEVAGVDARHRRARAAGLPILRPPRDEKVGQRNFIPQDPTGVLTDAIMPIPPSPEDAAQYASTALPFQGEPRSAARGNLAGKRGL